MSVPTISPSLWRPVWLVSRVALVALLPVLTVAIAPAQAAGAPGQTTPLVPVCNNGNIATRSDAVEAGSGPVTGRFLVFCPRGVRGALALVYTGEHYVIDVVAGWLTAVLALWVTTARSRASRPARKPSVSRTVSSDKISLKNTSGS